MSGFWHFIPFFLADFLKLCSVFPQIQVWALAGPLKDLNILVQKPFQHCFGYMLGVIVLLKRKSSPQPKVFCTLKQVLIKDLPVFCSIHYSLYP
jgi:hypothetical protein